MKEKTLLEYERWNATKIIQEACLRSLNWDQVIVVGCAACWLLPKK